MTEEYENGMENQNGQPRTYGDDSKMYAERQSQNAVQQNQYTQQQYGGQQQGQYTQQSPYTNQQNQYAGHQGRYTQPMPGYGQPYNGYMNQQPLHGPVADVFCWFVIVILPLRYILAYFTTYQMFSVMNYTNIMNGSYLFQIVNASYGLLTLLSIALMIAYIVFVVLDITKIYKQNYKITGLILFAVLFTPGYYMWRAHILGRKKTVPVIYTVLFVLLLLGYFIYIIYGSFSMVLEMLPYM